MYAGNGNGRRRVAPRAGPVSTMTPRKIADRNKAIRKLWGYQLGAYDSVEESAAFDMQQDFYAGVEEADRKAFGFAARKSRNYLPEWRSGAGIGGVDPSDIHEWEMQQEQFGIAPVIAAAGISIASKLFSGPKGPSIDALLTQALGGPATVGGGAIGAATELAEFASQPTLPDAAQYQQAWGIVVAQAPATAVAAYRNARSKPSLVPSVGAVAQIPAPATAPRPYAIFQPSAVPAGNTTVSTPIGTMTIDQVNALITQRQAQSQSIPGWAQAILDSLNAAKAQATIPPSVSDGEVPRPSVKTMTAGFDLGDKAPLLIGAGLGLFLLSKMLK